MSVTLQDINSHDERRVTLTIDGGPVLVKQYGKRKYRVTTIVITYRRKGSEPWNTSGLTLAGPYVKADGTDGVDENRDRFWRTDDQHLAWLGEFIDRYLPEPES